MPAAFRPATLAATSASSYWLLGTAPCTTLPCTRLIRATPGGTGFAAIPAPPATYDAGGRPATAVSQIRFADALNGWAYGGGLYATHNGGSTWHPITLGRRVDDLVVANGTVWAAVATCTSGIGCGTYAIDRSPVGTDSWTRSSAPVGTTKNAAAPSIAARGNGIYVLLNTEAGSRIAVSTDGGAQFRTHPAPCASRTGGHVAATDTAIFALCRTTTSATVSRSTDGGRTFTHVLVPAVLSAASRIAATGSSVIIGGDGFVLQTTDSGAIWSRTISSYPGSPWTYLGFVDATTGFAFRPASNGKGLYRTGDGGASWSVLASP